MAKLKTPINIGVFSWLGTVQDVRTALQRQMAYVYIPDLTRVA